MPSLKGQRDSIDDPCWVTTIAGQAEMPWSSTVHPDPVVRQCPLLDAGSRDLPIVR